MIKMNTYLLHFARVAVQSLLCFLETIFQSLIKLPNSVATYLQQMEKKRDA